MRLAAVLPGVVLAGQAAAERDVATLLPLRNCLEVDGGSAVSGAQRIGLVADAGFAATEGGETTRGISACLRAEAQAWGTPLNEDYPATRAAFADWDAREADHAPEFANRVGTLRDAQRAWIAFRDAECRMAHATWGSGSMRYIEGAHCRTEITARRAIDLRAMREEDR